MPPERGGTDRGRVRLSMTQLAAAIGATVSGAVAASFLGIYGTIIGTALMSLISTVGAVVYQNYLDRTRERLRTSRLAASVPRPRARGESAAQPVGAAGGSPAEAADAAEATSPAARPPWWRRFRPPRRWRLAAGVLGTAAAVFVVAFGIISVMEAVADKPTAKIVTGQPGSGTSLGTAVSEEEPVGPTETPVPGRTDEGAPDGGTPAPTSEPSGPEEVPTSEPGLQPTPDGESSAPRPAEPQPAEPSVDVESEPEPS